MLHRHYFTQLAGLCAIFFLFSYPVLGQNNVGIGTNAPNPHAVLQLVAPNANQGFLVPGLTTQQRNATAFTGNLSAADNGLIVFDLDEKAFYYWNDTSWKPIVSGTASQLLKPGPGININDMDEIMNTGDTDSTDDITIHTEAGGDLKGNYPAPEVKEGAIGNVELADNAVTSAKIADHTIVEDDFRSPGAGKVLTTSAGGQVIWDNQSVFGITFLEQGRIYVGNSSNQPEALDLRGSGNIPIGNGTSVAAVAMNGDVTMNSSGNTTISNNAVGANEVEDGSLTNTDISETAAISGSKISPDFGSQNITSTGNLSIQNIIAGGKVSSASTLDTDADTILTTKDYVDGQLAAHAQTLSNGNGLTALTYNGTADAQVTINNGAGLDFDGTGALQLSDAGVTAAKINTDVAGQGLVKGNTGALEMDIQSLTRTVGTGADNDLLAIHDASGGMISKISRADLLSNAPLNAGNVTSGTLSDARLSDVGAGAQTYNNVNSIEVDAKGRVINVTENTPSDIRLKKDITPLQHALEQIMQLNGYQYHWKDQRQDSTLQIGVIAQELEKVYPELVSLRSDDYKTVNYTGLIPVLIEAIKEQQTTIQSLQQQLEQIQANQQMESLQKENADIKAELQMIKAALGFR